MAKSPKKGYTCVLTVDAAAGGPDPSTVGKARDVELSASGNTVDISSRGGAGWKEFLAGIKEYEVSCDQLWVADDAALVLLRDAFLNGTTLLITLLDSNGDGFSGTVVVSSMKKAQPLDGGVMLPVTLKGTGTLTAVTV
jgi:predicted secreted protein